MAKRLSAEQSASALVELSGLVGEVADVFVEALADKKLSGDEILEIVGESRNAKRILELAPQVARSWRYTPESEKDEARAALSAALDVPLSSVDEKIKAILDAALTVERSVTNVLKAFTKLREAFKAPAVPADPTAPAATAKAPGKTAVPPVSES